MKEILAALLLCLLLGGALVNIGYLEGFTGELTGSLDRSLADAEKGDWDGAEKKLRSAIDGWNGADGYTHIFIRHSEIDSATDALYDLLAQVLSRDLEAATGACEKAKSHLMSIYTMERVTLGSIF